MQAIFKDGKKEPIFVGNQEVVERCFAALKDCFFRVIGNAKPIVEPFPYRIENHK